MSVMLLVASVALVADVTLLILAQTGRIDFRFPAVIGCVLCVPLLVGVLVVGRMNGHRELDDIVHPVRTRKKAASDTQGRVGYLT